MQHKWITFPYFYGAAMNSTTIFATGMHATYVAYSFSWWTVTLASHVKVSLRLLLAHLLPLRSTCCAGLSFCETKSCWGKESHEFGETNSELTQS